MEKFISKFNISSQVTKGTTKQCIICPKCNRQNVISTKNKFMLSKINTVNCIKCHQSIVIGDIFNFKTGNKLNNRLKNHNQDTFDNYIWNYNYDKL